MNMPGFTAETSLYQVVGNYSAHYLNATGKGESFASTRVLPQQTRLFLFPTETGGSDWRYPHDISAPGGLDGGGGFGAAGGSPDPDCNVRFVCESDPRYGPYWTESQERPACLGTCPDDASIIDWFASVLIGEDLEDERVVL